MSSGWQRVYDDCSEDYLVPNEVKPEDKTPHLVRTLQQEIQILSKQVAKLLEHNLALAKRVDQLEKKLK